MVTVRATVAFPSTTDTYDSPSFIVSAGSTAMTTEENATDEPYASSVVVAGFPTATRAMQHWVETRRRGFAQGITHSFSRLGNSLTPIMVVAIMGIVGWRGSFVVIGLAISHGLSYVFN